MELKDIKLKKGMRKEDVNSLVSDFILLLDDTYKGNKYNHIWECKCGNSFTKRWDNIRFRASIKCDECKYQEIENRYKTEVEKDGDYEYIKSFRKGDVLPNERVIKESYIQIKHKYCGNSYEVTPNNFINVKQRCSHCCQKYENSFAHHIEVELGEPLDKYWDFEKNTVNPYHISKNYEINKVWIKCTKEDHHQSYNTLCRNFIVGENRCPYCYSKKVHPQDSFAQYHIDNTDKDFLAKYWSDKNTIDPWKISPSSNKKVWIKCQERDYHGNYEISCNNFTADKRCSYCGHSKVHPLDSFGYKHFDKVMSWHLDNKISPFKLPPNSTSKFKFICETCGNEWESVLLSINVGSWCPKCASSKGEKRISEWLLKNNIKYVHDKPYFKDLKGMGNGILRPDFILPYHNIWIEYDGEFHYKSTGIGNDLVKQQIHDKRKDEYSKKHGWKMIRIPYWDYDHIEAILMNNCNHSTYLYI